MTNAHHKVTAACHEAVVQAIGALVLGQKPRLAEAGLSATDKKEVETVARRFLKHELGDKVLSELKKQLKTNDIEKVITNVVAEALARFFEIMFTRKSTWQSQLKR